MGIYANERAKEKKLEIAPGQQFAPTTQLLQNEVGGFRGVQQDLKIGTIQL